MTLDEAIDENKELRGELIRETRFKKAAGVQLGIEALNRIEALRDPVHYKIGYLLPSETKE